MIRVLWKLFRAFLCLYQCILLPFFKLLLLSGEAISQDWKRFKQQRMSLMVRDAEVSDSGMYRCKAVNGFGSRDVQIQLQVRSKSLCVFFSLMSRLFKKVRSLKCLLEFSFRY